MAALVAACGGAQPAASTGGTAAAQESEGGTPSGAVSTLEGVESATIQIVAEGTFQDPEVGTVYNAAGSGSGFIIDPSGIAVTNNHVVTGAALLEVYVGGEDEPRNARVLGVSECSDLAVIDIDGDGYPFLEWYDEELNTGLDVYAAGFPLGDPEFTLTRGIVSKADADGETGWASVDSVIEHDAAIQPGNSGGPLVTADGQVAGVNYAGGSPTNTEQFFAIAPDVARPIVDQLRNEEDVHSIGVNGQAINDGEGISGIWVASVDSGSPADEAGVAGGDIITTLEGLVLSTDGTMSDYCDVLRSHAPDDTLAIEVLRFATEEILEGQLNGDPLVQSFSFAEELAEDVEDAEGGGGGGDGATYSEYVPVEDESGTITVAIPAEWSDVQPGRWIIDEVDYGPTITAAPNIDDWVNGWATPGVFFGASSTLRAELDVPGILDLSDFSDVCTLDTRYDYEDPLYTGAYDVYHECGGEGSTFIQLAAEPADGSYILFLQMVLVGDADLEAIDQILNTFQVIGEL
jgi:serine protease Do